MELGREFVGKENDAWTAANSIYDQMAVVGCCFDLHVGHCIHAGNHAAVQQVIGFFNRHVQARDKRQRYNVIFRLVCGQRQAWVALIGGTLKTDDKAQSFIALRPADVATGLIAVERAVECFPVYEQAVCDTYPYTLHPKEHEHNFGTNAFTYPNMLTGSELAESLHLMTPVGMTCADWIVEELEVTVMAGQLKTLHAPSGTQGGKGF